ncbi:MAG: hypothetical protein QNJ55_03225 [Xenococcus sp. MO_188.B8]|nr:hypothetical protein [Xenococcus sp. MO_188.B8]
MPVTIDQSSSNIFAGGDGSDGDLVLRNGTGQNRIRLDANGANGWFGGNGEEGNIWLFASSSDNATGSQATIHLNGGTGDIILQNADCAEDFPVEDPELLEPGTVVAIGKEARLRISESAYNKRVAGVIAGAGDLKPGIILGRNSNTNKQLPVALMGRVYCKVDANHGAIEVGDLLTTSSTPGHAMKASDPLRSFGAVIGKALSDLKSGTGLIPVLVALQ